MYTVPQLDVIHQRESEKDKRRQRRQRRAEERLRSRSQYLAEESLRRERVRKEHADLQALGYDVVSLFA
jgi:hypothetical protein